VAPALVQAVVVEAVPTKGNAQQRDGRENERDVEGVHQEVKTPRLIQKARDCSGCARRRETMKQTARQVKSSWNSFTHRNHRDNARK
jgi:hypothetical protein